MGREAVAACHELEPDDVIEAYLRGRWEFTGRVTEIDAGLELFWAVDSIGHRRLVDLASFAVYRLPPAPSAPTTPCLVPPGPEGTMR